MKTIIAATDFSPASLNAVDYAADMACQLSARLSIINVYTIPLPVSDGTIPVFYVEEAEESSQRQLSALKDKLLVRTGQRIIIHTEMRGGAILPEIESYCATVKPHAVVMGGESSGAIERLLFGGETTGALAKLTWPLIVVPPFASFKDIRKVGLACDLKDVVKSVNAQEIKELVEEFNAELHILHVSKSENDNYSARKVEESALLQEMLGAMNPKYHFLQDQDMEKGISEFVQKNGLDLLIVIPKSHGLLERIFQHSHSKRVVLQSQIPVMAIHE